MKRVLPKISPVPLRAAVIGCGSIGSRRSEERCMEGVLSHAEAYIACPETKLVALADTDEDALQVAGRYWGIDRLYIDAARLLREEKPDVISVCTPDLTHAGIVRVALQAGTRAILCEKPLATNVHDAMTLASLAKECNAVLAVNYSRRYDPMHRSVREFILGGKLGRLRHVTGWYSKGIVHNGTHLLDAFRFLCGEISVVEGFNARLGTDTDMNPDALLYFSNGCQGWIHGCRDEDFTIFEIDLLGSSGRIRIAEGGHSVEYFSVGESKYYPGYKELVPTPFVSALGLRDALLYAIEDVVHALRTGSLPLGTPEDAVRALELAQEIVRQAKSKIESHTSAEVVVKTCPN